MLTTPIATLATASTVMNLGAMAVVTAVITVECDASHMLLTSREACEPAAQGHYIL
jgi:hypothetical protein